MERKASIVRGVFGGAVAGMVGCLAMAGFQELVARSTDTADERDHGPHAPAATEESTTETAARKVARQFGRDLPRQQKQLAGRVLHYGFGTVMGAFYGAAAEYFPVIGFGAGTVFGTVLFLATDEASLPLLHLASQPADTPPVDHMLHCASHVAYTMTLEITRRAIRSRF